MNSNFKKDVIACFKELLPIFSNPGNEQDMFNFVRKKFMDIGFVDHKLPLLQRNYEIHHKIGGDGTVYSRKAPNLGLSFIGDIEQPTYFFNAHLDHYFAGNITTEYLQDGDWIVSDGKNLLGADCKMGIAIIYAWAKRMLAWNKVPNIDILFDTCEEPGLIGVSEFVDEKLYLDMPFYKNYKAGKPVFAYSIDGAWSEDIGKRDYCFLTRPTALALSQYLSKNEQNKICVVEGSQIRWRNLRKKEKGLISSLELICPGLNINNIEVVRFGAAFVFLNKILPCVLLPVGYKNQHTSDECYWLPYLDVHENNFDKSLKDGKIY